MELFHIGFLPVRLVDVIDIVIVSFLLYKLYTLLRGGVAVNIFIGLLFILVIYWLCVKVFKMQLLGSIIGQFISVGIIALVIVFQPELRRFLILLGTDNVISKNVLTRRILPWNWSTQKNTVTNFYPVINACKQMSRERTGALIVLSKSSELKFYSNTGDPMDAEVSQRLIESIFFKNSPLHDGAIIIVNNRIRAARCVLPVTERLDLPAHLGMRHRAAIGVSEHSDAIAIIVSEETGEISYAKEGQLTANVTPEQLEIYLRQEFA